MPIAAVPRYLGQDFASASPGMRFGMYLNLWGINRRTKKLLWTTYDLDYEIRGQQREEREVRKENKESALRTATVLNSADKAVQAALIARQKQAAQTVALEERFSLQATAIAPFTTGLGNEHPLENGFAFLWPYGLPYLPGSGVKGVVRRAAQELASGEWGETHGWSTDKAYTLSVGKERIGLSVVDVLFGLESGDGETEHVRGALSFWDVIPQIKGDSLMVEIMTPHQSHYYQEKREPKSGNSNSPHDSGQPNPITFLTVRPGSQFAFHVVCDRLHLERLTANRAEGASDLLAEDNGAPRWHQLLAAAFEHAFEWLGFGAKTAVGYGAMKSSPTAAVATPAKGDNGSESRTPASQSKELTWPSATLTFNPGTGEIKAVYQGQATAGLKGDQANALREALGERAAKLKKSKELKNVAVRVRKEGNLLTLIGLDQPAP